jgi:hypothetical protein
LFHEYFIHQLGEREVLAIKFTTPAICLSTIDDDFFYARCDFVIFEHVYVLNISETLLDGRKATLYQ